MNISLPDALKAFVDEQIRKDQDRHRLRGLLLAGAVSEPAPPDTIFYGARDIPAWLREGDGDPW